MDEQSATTGEDLLSFDEAIKFLDTSKSTLYRLLSQEEVRGVKVGKQWRFRRADLTAYIERSPVEVSVGGTVLVDLEAEARFFAEEISAEGHVPMAVADVGRTVLVDALASRILQLAVVRNASDVHLEPGEGSLRLRFRIDGVLHDIRRMPINLQDSLVLRLKEMGDMNLVEKRIPQDGRHFFQIGEREYDVRMCVLPTLLGESVVMRVLDRNWASLGLEKLGFDPVHLEFLRSSIHRPSGLVLVTGPSGSGKTSLLYSCLLETDSSGAKLISIEDPVECRLPNVVQMQVNKRAGLTFAAGMRSALRSDPDVILCGELPDRETIEVTLRAALTGQVVFSALHADDCLSAVNRLVDIGIERYLITSSLNTIVATRRARKLCSHCKSVSDSAPLLPRIRPLAENGGYRIPSNAVFFAAEGCDRCRGTGFQGRLNLYEVLPCNPKMLAQLVESDSQDAMLRVAVESGMTTLFADGVRHAAEGETSLEEVLRVTDTGL